MTYEINGKAAFVTGGTSGIGLGIAMALAQLGARVAVTFRREAQLEEAMRHLAAAGSKVRAVHLDVTDRTAFAAAAAQTEAVMGPIDILCNNAGVSLMGPAEDCLIEDWNWIMDANLNGVMNGVRAFVPGMKRRGHGGYIVNVGSIAAFVPNGFAGAYVTSKYALRGLTETLRLSLAQHSINVSLVSPGLTNTGVYSSAQRRDSRTPGTVMSEQELASRAARHAQGSDPFAVGRCVVEGLIRKEAHIVTHPEMNAQVLGQLAAEAHFFRDDAGGGNDG